MYFAIRAAHILGLGTGEGELLGGGLTAGHTSNTYTPSCTTVPLSLETQKKFFLSLLFLPGPSITFQTIPNELIWAGNRLERPAQGFPADRIGQTRGEELLECLGGQALVFKKAFSGLSAPWIEVPCTSTRNVPPSRGVSAGKAKRTSEPKKILTETERRF